ncbi:DUF2513 domain-containing protein [Caballeronia sp. GAWG1-5s-s]|uniref:DUF2513 domain-containing protein n=1 Tax=Caballeronia sp. GAWG1-5s-s TaxID=2921743 RepID=UPI002028ED74|nr:DUF2513 domain-containing protein [Caballeronia sp. GAWG1-5s-s]
MKRDWELLRQQLTDIEEDRDPFAAIPTEPRWTSQTEAEFTREYEEYRATEAKICGHLEMLIDNGYVDGLKVMRGSDGHFSWGDFGARLTMNGHDLLDTMRSKPVWEQIKSTAQAKGIELTFDAIKAIGGWALKHVLTA